MIIRAVRQEEKLLFNQAVEHPLQSWEWGEFRRRTGQTVERLGFFDDGRLVKGTQVTFHALPAPLSSKTVGYFPKGFMPDEDQLSALSQIAAQHNALFIKMEPNVAQPVGTPSAHQQITEFLINNNAVPGRPLFTKYTFVIDLTKTEEELFANLKNKTRYNVNVAYRKGVRIVENTTQEGMDEYIKILQETTTRQGFYAHTPDYFKTMWEVLGQSGMLKIFQAVYEGTVLVSWIMFVFNGVLYYPYGASRSQNRDVMASNLMLWEMIRYGKQQGCVSFDLWGSLGPEPDTKHPWYGFHRFKEGYGGTLMEFVGTYDLVMNHPMYKLFSVAENLRWKWLRLKTRLPW